MRPRKLSYQKWTIPIWSTPGLSKLKLLSSILLFFTLFISNQSNAQSIPISGKVIGASGSPISGVSVTVKGTRTGTTTDEAGNFQINAEKGNILLISSVGFLTQELTIPNDISSFSTTITMVVGENKLDEVVVIGYGTQRRRDVTGAVVSIKESAIREVPVANIQQALQGRAAGLEVQSTGNQPGAGAQIRIRGTRSISGSNDPLIVLDGIPYEGSLNDINPDDIASIEVLKDASATAIYGSRGANGILLISTKRGKSGETRISYNGYYGVGSALNPFPVFNAQEYMAMRNTSTWGQGYLPQEIEGMANGTNTNWQDLMYQNSFRTDHNITASGGSNGNTFSLGGGYFKENTLLPGEDFTRYTVRAAIDAKVGRKIKIGLTSLNNVSIQNGAQFVSGSPLFRMLAMSPLVSPYLEDGRINPTPWGNIDDINGSGRYSPLYLQTDNPEWHDRIRRIRTFTSLYGEYQFTKDFKYRINAGFSYAQQHNAQFQPADIPGSPSFFRAAQGNIASVQNGETWGYTLENLLIYDKVFKDKHKVNFTGLYSIQENQSFDNFVQKDSIADNFVRFYNLALSTPINSNNTALGGGESKWALVSYMARLNYGFDNKYLATLTYRRDGSSRLAKGNQWFDYWAGSLGWNIHEENFMRNIKPLSALKLRASYGTTSNQAVNPYQSLGLVNNSNGIGGNAGITRYNFGPTIVSGYNIINLPNPNLSWEFTNVFNLGLDFGLLNNRITGALEVYWSKTNDILYGINLPASSGVAGSFVTNIGSMQNNGAELSISAVHVETKSGFSWSGDYNLFFNRNKLLNLNGNITEQPGNQLFVGHPMTAIWDYKKLGIWQSNEAAEAASFGARPGQIKLADVSGPDGKPDGRISIDDKYVIGSGDARLQGGMTQRFAFKGFDVSAVFYARFGGMLFSQVHQPFSSFLTVMDGRRNTLNVDYWTPNNPSNWFPMPQQEISNVSDAWSTLGYYDGTFVKLRSINFGYSFKPAILKKLNAQLLRAYFTIDNVATMFSPYFKQTGFDPEATGTGSQGVSNPGNIRGGNNGMVTIGLGTPPRRTFTFGLNVTL
jgi:TonB-linked SusC/RagA family outer membrane protein